MYSSAHPNLQPVKPARFYNTILKPSKCTAQHTRNLQPVKPSRFCNAIFKRSQECISIGCVPSASVSISGEGKAFCLEGGGCLPREGCLPGRCAEWHTGVKTLPCPKLRLWTVKLDVSLLRVKRCKENCSLQAGTRSN